MGAVWSFIEFFLLLGSTLYWWFMEQFLLEFVDTVTTSFPGAVTGAEYNFQVAFITYLPFFMFIGGIGMLIYDASRERVEGVVR